MNSENNTPENSIQTAFETEVDPFDAFLEVLNTAYQADPAAIHALICNRVPCNEALANHPDVTVSENLVVGEGYVVSMLGVINGICSSLTGKLVAAVFSDEEQPRLLGFAEYQKQD